MKRIMKHRVLIFISAVLLFIIVTAAAVATPSSDADSERKVYRVAFVFAGAPRSFTTPVISESIRHNLIQSFCPPVTSTGVKCMATVFANILSIDNVHVFNGKAVLDGSGVAIPVQENKVRVGRALNRLLKPFGSASSLGENEVLIQDHARISLKYAFRSLSFFEYFDV